MPTVPDIHRRGTRADQGLAPSPPLTVGTLWFVTDEDVTERWDGSGWEAYSGAGGGGGGVPSAHHTTHENGGTDEITVLGLSGLLADAQTPLAHKTTHQSAGADAIPLDTLAAPTDITTLNATTGAHGLLRKLSGTTTEFLNGAGAWATPAGGGGTGDVVGPAASVDGEIALFNGTTGKLLKRATGTGPAKLTSGVLSAAPIDLSLSEVTGDLPFSKLTQAGSASKLLGRGSAAFGGDYEEIALGTGLAMAGTTLSAAPRTAAVGITLDGGGSVLTTGVKGFVEVPFAGTITAATLLSTDAASTAGSIVIDVWKDTYAAYPPVVGDSITASAKPTLSSANKSRDTTLSGWSTAIAAGDVLGFKVDSVATLTRVTLTLTVSVP